MIADAAPDNWVDRFAPKPLRPYLKLARADRPIGIWLLFWPCAWGLALGAAPWPDPRAFIFFALGAIVMRGAGCTFNDIVDRDFDARVARTALRPIASGAVGLRSAILFLLLQLCLGLLILLQFNRATIAVGCASLALIAIYPFMKRITWWPQFFLGLAFNWGVLMGVAAGGGSFAPPVFLVYAAGIFWTLGYDTIYALQDREDDALIGVKSTARLFGAKVRLSIGLFYSALVAALTLAGAQLGCTLGYYLVLGAVAAHLTWQLAALDTGNAANCLIVFKANRWTGALVFAALFLCRMTGA